MNENELITFISEIPLDIRVEVVVADLIASGYNATDLFIKPKGIFQRRFSKDILSAEVVELNNSQKVVFVNTPRESLYDMLPQSFFHYPPAKGSKAFKSSTDMVADYRKRVLEEEESRKYFLIYEIEFYRQRLANVILERNLSEAVSYSMNDREILSYWRLPDCFDNRQKGILFYLFPVFHKIRGSLVYMKEVYQLILQQNVEIVRVEKIQNMVFPNNDITLGNMVLSLNSILGCSYNYYYPSFQIKVEHLPKASFFDFLPGGRNLKVIEKLNEYFVPVFCEAEIEIETDKHSWILNVMDKNESRLGYSIYL